jgi:hypothetical protein
LTDAEWARAAHAFLRDMGMVGTGFDAADVPYAVVRHAADHIHVVASRIRFDGRTWHDARDYRRSHHAARAAERELGLLDASLVRGREMATVTKSERERAARNGVEPERVQLCRFVEHARDTSDGTLRGFESVLASEGVLFRANVASTGRMSGYSFSLRGWVDRAGSQVWLPASKVHRELRWSQLSRDLELVQERRAEHTRSQDLRTPSVDLHPNTHDRGR